MGERTSTGSLKSYLAVIVNVIVHSNWAFEGLENRCFGSSLGGRAAWDGLLLGCRTQCWGFSTRMGGREGERREQVLAWLWPLHPGHPAGWKRIVVT